LSSVAQVLSSVAQVLSSVAQVLSSVAQMLLSVERSSRLAQWSLHHHHPRPHRRCHYNPDSHNTPSCR
jgi:hypothetical protein